MRTGKEPIAITASGHLHNIHPLNASRTAVVDDKTTSCNHDPATHTGHTTDRPLIPPHLVCKDCPPGVANQLFTAIRFLLCCCNRAKNDSQDGFDLPSDSAEALSMHPRMDMDLAVTDHPALAGLISMHRPWVWMVWHGLVWYGCGQTSPIVERSKYVCMVRSEPGQAS